MVRKIDWDNQIGRRLRLRDLHVFFTVVQRGSMAKAAAHLGVSQPAVSEVIGNLEHALGVRLLDRSPQGIEPTMYGRALIKRGTVAFDELKQSIRDIEFLADPSVGELRIGCAESVAAAILPPIVERFCLKHPGIVVHVTDVVSPSLDLPELRERTLDLCLARLVRPLTSTPEDLNAEILLDDEMVITAGAQNRWTHRRKIDLAELINEPWILTPPHSRNYISVAEAFRSRGLEMPKVSLMSFSVHLRANMVATGPFITAFPRSVLDLIGDRFSLKVLPVDIEAGPWPVAMITLKNRTLSPVVQLFIDHLRAHARMLATGEKIMRKARSAQPVR
jgi:DNA-binding transcriptional LysR family regulator